MPHLKPAWWCRGAHAQTILGAFLRRRPRLNLNRVRLETPDGDFLDIDFLEQPPANAGHRKPLVIILHGLEGSSRAPYVQSLIGEIQKYDWSAAAVNMRMCSGELNRLRQSYHSGKTEDLDFVVDYLEGRGQWDKIYLAGFSIGGNIVLKWLGEQGERASKKIHKAAAISVPYDLTKAVGEMDRGFNREVYTRLLLLRLKTKVVEKEKVYPGLVRLPFVKRSKTFSEFDREVTAPLNGFKDEKDYWSRSSCRNFLSSVRVPTLLIHAEDDPFFPGKFLPLDDIRSSSFLKPLIVPCGGHLGFMSGSSPWRTEPWLETQILQFLGSHGT